MACSLDCRSASRLRASRFGLLEIGLRDGFVRVEILRALVKFVGELEGVARFDVGGAQSANSRGWSRTAAAGPWSRVRQA